MQNNIYTEKFSNGVTLIAERIEHVQSAAFSILMPSGVANDAADRIGAQSLLVDLLHKGAGEWNTKELSEQFEQLGAHKSSSAGVEASGFSCVLLCSNLAKAIKLYSTVILNPTLPDEELSSIKELALQEIQSLEDEPSRKVMIEVARNFYPEPFNRSSLGDKSAIESVTVEELKSVYRNQFCSSELIIGVAGRFEWSELKDVVQEAFSGWQGKSSALPAGNVGQKNINKHLSQTTNQVQIALAFPSCGVGETDYYKAKLMVGVLSGGMAGRLFVEVREKRGLVYNVSASHSSSCRRPGIFVYAGTTPENGQKTLDVILTELKRLKEGASAEELHRAKLDLKSRVVIQGEHSSVRASALSNDWWKLGRTRLLEEIKDEIDKVTHSELNEYLASIRMTPITLATLGPNGLELGDEIF